MGDSETPCRYKWYWFFLPSRSEPRELHWACLSFGVLVLLGYAFNAAEHGAAIEPYQDVFDGARGRVCKGAGPTHAVREKPEGCDAATCDQGFADKRERQMNCRLHNICETLDDLDVSTRRIAVLEEALTQPTSPQFADAPTALDQERARCRTLDKQLGSYRIQPAGDAYWTDLVFFLVTILIVLFGKKLLFAHAGYSFGALEKKLGRWWVPWLLIAAASFAVLAAREYYTSCHLTDKAWFGWSSCQVDRPAFGLMLGYEAALCLHIAAPFAVLWRLGSSAWIPELNVSNLGERRHEKYVLFLQSTSIMLLIMLAAGGVLWVKYAMAMQAEFELAYLASGVGLYAVGVLIIARNLRDAVVLRERYRTVLDGLDADARKARQDRAPDPTRGFIGDKWWGLPATLMAVLLAIWALLEWLEIDLLIKGTL